MTSGPAPKTTGTKVTAYGHAGHETFIVHDADSPPKIPKVKSTAGSKCVNNPASFSDVNPVAPTPTLGSAAGSKRSSHEADLEEHVADVPRDDSGSPPPPPRQILKIVKKRKAASGDAVAIQDPIPSTEGPQVARATTKAPQPAPARASAPSPESTAPVPTQDDVVMSGTDDEQETQDTSNAPSELHLLTVEMKRKDRILHPDKNPRDAALIAAAPRDGPEIYDDDATPLPGKVGHNISNPEWYENVRFSLACYDTETEPFVESYHTYTPFVPGRFERMADGTVRDQKHKLIVRVIDSKTGNRMIFRNPPPKDWNHQEAITATNKRIAQQYRRNSNIRFRRVMTPYCKQEREWILTQLGKDGKPRKGWTTFCTEFNEQFEGKIIADIAEPRQARTASSLTKEVERFAADYKAGRVPIPVADKDKRKVGAKRKAAVNADIPADAANAEAGPSDQKQKV